MILSGNGIDHAVLTLGAYAAGVPVVPVSVAYSLASRDHSKLKHIYAEIRPLIFYAGAAISQDIWDRLEAVSVQTTGMRVPMISSWGATETSPVVTSGQSVIERAGVIGLPAPGVAMKFVPSGSKLEVRVKGPNVFPGYWGRPDLTEAAFDEEGFYCIGDAARLADPGDPSKGVLFDGRVAEDFKLSSGTWVYAGGLRIAALAAAAPAFQDAVVTGQDRAFVGLLAWPNLTALKQMAGTDQEPGKLIASDVVREHVRKGIAAYNAGQSGSSSQIRRVLIMDEPPSIDANEITDKGYINQRAVLERRAPLIERLYAPEPPADVIVVG